MGTRGARGRGLLGARVPLLCHVALPLLPLLPLLRLCDSSRHQITTCPSTCVGYAGKRQFVGKAPVDVTFSTVANCRRACHINGYRFYLYTNQGQCQCYKVCQGVKANASAPPAVLGLSSGCPDAVCPRACESAVGLTYILRPGPRYLSQQGSIQACQQVCQPLGQYYAYSNASVCSCYQGCLSVITYPLSIPARTGRLSACFDPTTPKTYRCTEFRRKCPAKCVPGSSCVSSTGLDLKTRYQCCCQNGRQPVVENDMLVSCRATSSR